MVALGGAVKRGTRGWAYLVTAVTALAVGLFTLAAWRQYEQLRHDRITGEVVASRRVLLAFENHATRLFDYGDAHLRAVRSNYQRHGGGEGLRRHLGEVALRDGASITGLLLVIDRDGRVVFSSDPQAQSADVTAVGLEYFQTLREEGKDVLLIDPTRRGRVSGEFQFRLVRPIINQGRFDGVILLTLRPESLGDFFRAFDLGPRSVLVMVKDDGRFIVRQPLPSHEIYGTRLDVPLLWEGLRHQQQGGFRLTSVTDGTVRHYSYKRLDAYPVVVTVGVAEVDILDDLADARRRILVQTVTADLAAVGFCVLVLAILQRNRRLGRERLRLAYKSAELQQANRDLAQSNADLERFAYVASHDLQTPLRNMVIYAQLLERRYSDRLDGDGVDFLNFIIGGARHMSALIADLLAYARISGRDHQAVPVDASSALAQAIDTLGLAIDAAGASVAADRLPRVMADEVLLVSVFQNLIGNALKYRHPERRPVIHVGAVPEEESLWRFSVSDNGAGIDPAYFGKIFEIFQRLDPQGVPTGTGIGLTICQRIVHLFGGRIWVDSTPGAGTTFFFTLPAAD